PMQPPPPSSLHDDDAVHSLGARCRYRPGPARSATRFPSRQALRFSSFHFSASRQCPYYPFVIVITQPGAYRLSRSSRSTVTTLYLRPSMKPEYWLVHPVVYRNVVYFLAADIYISPQDALSNLVDGQFEITQPLISESTCLQHVTNDSELIERVIDPKPVPPPRPPPQPHGAPGESTSTSGRRVMIHAEPPMYARAHRPSV
ncbi:hypothetical protein J6590_054382, partial [Homalodisca vitripennis]